MKAQSPLITLRNLAQEAVEQAAQNVVPRVTERLREQDVRRVAVQQANCT